jgi:polyribonucleotide nucleotidyltransferase
MGTCTCNSNSIACFCHGAALCFLGVIYVISSKDARVSAFGGNFGRIFVTAPISQYSNQQSYTKRATQSLHTSFRDIETSISTADNHQSSSGDEISLQDIDGIDDIDGLADILHAITEDDDDNDAAKVDEVESIETILAKPVPPESITVTSEEINGSKVHTLTVSLGAPGHEEPFQFQTGKIGRQASGAVTLTCGETLVYSTACRSDQPEQGKDFAPLSVEYQERFSSVGSTSSGYNKRDGRPAEHELLTCRLIDRPLRPLIHSGWRHDTQLIAWVLSYDGKRDCDPLAVTAAAAALWISDVPLLKPVAAVQVGFIDGHFLVNPTVSQQERSQLQLTVAGTKDAVLMVEGAANFLPEQTMVEAVAFGHKYVKIICEGLQQLSEKMQVQKKTDTISLPIPGLAQAVEDLMIERIDEALRMGTTTIITPYEAKEKFSQQQSSMQFFLVEQLRTDERFLKNCPDEQQLVQAIQSEFKSLLSRQMYRIAKETNRRIDGRAINEVRPISIEVGLLPRVHGSALFTRGQTQTIATATLGDSTMRQKIDKIDGMIEKRFYLQYTFPPSCVGETGRFGSPGRREVGHGHLAERALAPSLPSESSFPYSIRVESLITESHGSSSMASVCGGCLALMNSGVPIEQPVAGIAMGMFLEDTHASTLNNAPVIVSDISGTEDALGTMDFKVAGDKVGITAFQLDIKCEGLTLDTLQTALEQAREGRLFILDEMEKALGGERKRELPPTVPKISTFTIPQDKIGRVIGPGGKQIRAIVDDFKLTNMDVGEDGTIQCSAMNATMLELVRPFVEELISSDVLGKRGGGRQREPKAARPVYSGPEPEIGQVYKGKITGIHAFGCFVEFLPGSDDGSTPGLEGLCHVSELHVERVRNCEGFLNSLQTDELEVKLLGKNEKGQYQLSRKALLLERRGKVSVSNAVKE